MNENMEWGGITQYEIDGKSIQRADAFRYDPETFEYERVSLNPDDRILFKEGAEFPEDIPDDFELLGLTEDYYEPATVWAVYASDELEWCAIVVDDDAPLGRMSRELNGETDE